MALQYQADFQAIPAAIPVVVSAVAKDNSRRHPPRPPVIAWLVEAALEGYNGETFSAAARAVGSPPRIGQDVKTVLFRLAFEPIDIRTDARKASGEEQAPNGSSGLDALARQLPTVDAARQRGLTLDRLNYLAESTRLNSGLQSVRTWSEKDINEGSILLMASSREHMVHDDQLFGHNIETETQAAIRQNIAELESLPPSDIDTLQRFYTSPEGRAYAAWIGAVLVRAHDNAGAATNRAFYREIRAHPQVQINQPS